jgi:hypothetical protein
MRYTFLFIMVILIIIAIIIAFFLNQPAYHSDERDKIRLTASDIHIRDDRIRLHVRVANCLRNDPGIELGHVMPIYGIFYDQDRKYISQSVVLIDSATARPSLLSKRLLNSVGESDIEFVIPEGATALTVQLPTFGAPTAPIPLVKP